MSPSLVPLGKPAGCYHAPASPCRSAASDDRPEGAVPSGLTTEERQRRGRREDGTCQRPQAPAKGRAAPGGGKTAQRHRYWPVLATVSIDRPASFPLLPETSVLM